MIGSPSRPCHQDGSQREEAKTEWINLNRYSEDNMVPSTDQRDYAVHAWMELDSVKAIHLHEDADEFQILSIF